MANPYAGYLGSTYAPGAGNTSAITNPNYQPVDKQFQTPPLIYGQGVQALNALSSGLLSQIQPGAGGLPYNPPGAQNNAALIQALMRMSAGTAAGQATPGAGTGGGAGLMGRDVQMLMPALQRAAMLQEPQRIQQLLQLMLGGYGLAGQLYAQPTEQAARIQLQDIAKQSARDRALSGIPVVGTLLGGLGL